MDDAAHARCSTGRSCAWPRPRSTSVITKIDDRERQRPGRRERVEVLALDELHDEEQPALGVAIEVEHRDDVRVRAAAS